MSGIIESYQRKFDTNKIFLSSQQIVVYWAHITVIKAELICFEDLLEFPGGHSLTTWTQKREGVTKMSKKFRMWEWLWAAGPH